MTTRLLLLRHGESEWNALRRWQGQADPALTSLGRRQAAAAGEALERMGVCPNAVASSDLQRARGTAELIVERLGGSVAVEPLLRERDVGAVSGLTGEQARAAFAHLVDPDTGRFRSFPGGETDDALFDRARRAVTSLAGGSPGGVVLAITHGGLIRAVEALAAVRMGGHGNLGGRWFTVTPAGHIEAGDVVHFAEVDAVAAELL